MLKKSQKTLILVRRLSRPFGISTAYPVLDCYEERVPSNILVLNEQLSSHIDFRSYSTHLPPFTFMSEKAVLDIFPVGD